MESTLFAGRSFGGSFAYERAALRNDVGVDGGVPAHERHRALHHQRRVVVDGVLRPVERAVAGARGGRGLAPLLDDVAADRLPALEWAAARRAGAPGRAFFVNKQFSVLAAILVAAGSLAVAAGGCSAMSGMGGTGGSSSSTTTTTTTATTTTSGTGGTAPVCDGGTACQGPSDCTTASDCVAGACIAGCCLTGDVTAGTACTSNGGRVCNGNGNCVACLGPLDCTAPATNCVTNTCTNSVCGMMNAAVGTACTDSGGTVCDGTGMCGQCNQDSDCTTGPCNVCPPAANLCLAPLAPVASLAGGACKSTLAACTPAAPTCGPLGTFAVGNDPQGIAFDGTSMWVTNEADNTVTELSPAGATLGTFAVGTEPE